MMVQVGSTQTLGREHSRLRFGPPPQPGAAWTRRVLQLDGRDAFELSLWCGTCPFLFKRLEGANDRLSIEAMEARLTAGCTHIDTEVIASFGSLLPQGAYLPLLLSVEPRAVLPAKPGDYFYEEQVATWGVDSFWGLPEYTQTPYYRTFETSVSSEAHLYEFVVPMVPPSWNQPEAVRAHRARLESSSQPTAVAVSTLDVCAPATDDEGPDWYWHWGLTHFLLDGHHKMEPRHRAVRDCNSSRCSASTAASVTQISSGQSARSARGQVSRGQLSPSDGTPLLPQSGSQRASLHLCGCASAFS